MKIVDVPPGLRNVLKLWLKRYDITDIFVDEKIFPDHYRDQLIVQKMTITKKKFIFWTLDFKAVKDVCFISERHIIVEDEMAFREYIVPFITEFEHLNNTTFTVFIKRS